MAITILILTISLLGLFLYFRNSKNELVIQSIITGPILDKELDTLDLSKTTIPAFFDYIIITSAGELYNTKFYYKDYLAFSSQLDPKKVYFTKKESVSINNEFIKDSPTKDNWKEGTLIIIYINNIPYLRRLNSSPVIFLRYNPSLYMIDFIRFNCYIPGTKESETITISHSDKRSYKRIYRVCFELDDIKQIKRKDDKINYSIDKHFEFSELH